MTANHNLLMPPKIKMPSTLTDLPNIGKAIAADLSAIGIVSPGDFNGKDFLKIFHDLKPIMGHRHDPCLYYTLLSVKHYFLTGESLPWWKFTDQGKADLLSRPKIKLRN